MLARASGSGLGWVMRMTWSNFSTAGEETVGGANPGSVGISGGNRIHDRADLLRQRRQETGGYKAPKRLFTARAGNREIVYETGRLAEQGRGQERKARWSE